MSVLPPAVDHDLFIDLTWDDEDEDWEVVTNCSSQEELVAGLLHVVFKLAIGDLEYVPPEDSRTS